MRKLLSIIALSLCLLAPAGAQLMMTGVGGATPSGGSGGSYTGPGDIVSGAKFFVGLEAYSAAYASGGGKLANACLPSGGSCFDITANTTTGMAVIPAGLSTCNNSTTICTIKTLYDQSGANACAGATACDVTQATQGSAPTLIVAGAANGCPNTSLPCIGNQNKCLASAASLTLAQPFSMAVVIIRTTNFTTTQRGLTNSAISAQLSFTNSANTIGVFAGGSATLTVTDNVWHAGQGVFNGASSSMNADGTSGTTANAGAGTFGSQVTVADDSTTGVCDQPLNGNYAEMGIWGIAFSGAQISAMNTNAHSAGRWNF